MSKNYLPERGDIVWVNFDPSKGSEQRGLRPALILTPALYNSFGLCYCMPITSKQKGYAIEVKLGPLQQTQGVILTNQMQALDWKVRNFRFVEKIESTTLDLVGSRLRTLLTL